MGVRGRVERGEVREQVARGRGRARARPSEQRAKPPRRSRRPRRRRGTSAHTTSTRLARGDRATRASAAQPVARARRHPGVAAPPPTAGAGRRPPEGRVELGQRPGEIVRPARRALHGAGAHGRAQRRTSRGSTAPFQRVALEARRSRRRACPARRAGGGEPNATARARAPPRLTVKRTCLPSPIARGSGSAAAGTSSATSGLPIPNGASRSSSSASASPS